MRESLKATREANRLTLRARLVVEDVEPVPAFSSEDKTIIKITVKNVGKLPVSNLVFRVVPEIAVHQTVPPIPVPQWNFMEHVIADTKPVTISYGVPQISESTITDIVNKMVTFTLVAKFLYTDALKTDGETRFCPHYVPGTPEALGHFMLTGLGNSVT